MSAPDAESISAAAEETHDIPDEPTSTAAAAAAPAGSAKGSGQSNGWREKWAEAAKTLENTHGKVVVRNPEVVGTLFGTSGKYVQYELFSESTGVSVFRRFNDFVWLREALVGCYVGLLIPALPGTKFSANSTVSGFVLDVSSDYITNRLAQLNTFMAELLKIPFLRQDAALYAFLNATVESDLKEAKETSKTSSSLEAASQGAVLWRALLADVNIPSDAESSIADVRRQQDKMRSALSAIETAASVLGKKALAFAREMHSYTACSIQWSEQEVDLADQHKNKLPNRHGMKLQAIMKSLVVGCGHWSLNVALWPKTIAAVLFLNIQYQLMQVGAMQELLKFREETVRELERAEHDLSRLMEHRSPGAPGANVSASATATAGAAAASTEGSTSSSSGSGAGGDATVLGEQPLPSAVTSTATPKARTSSFSFGSMTAMFSKGTEEEQIETKQAQVNHLTAVLRNCTRGLLFSEIDRFNSERFDNIQKMVGCLIAANIKIAKLSEEKWVETASMAGLSVSDYEKGAEEVLMHAGATAQGSDLEHLFSTNGTV